MLVSDRTFVQVLEGDEAVVTALFETIRNDDRQDSVELLATGPIPARDFGHWAMARFSEDGEHDIP